MTNESWHIHSVCWLHSRQRVECLYIHTIEQMQSFCGIWTQSLISFITLPQVWAWHCNPRLLFVSIMCSAGYFEFYDQGVWNQGGKPRDGRCARVRNKKPVQLTSLLSDWQNNCYLHGSNTTIRGKILFYDWRYFSFQKSEIANLIRDFIDLVLPNRRIAGYHDEIMLLKSQEECVLMLSPVCVDGPWKLKPPFQSINLY